MNRYTQTLPLKRRKKSSFRGYNVGKFPPPGKIRHCHKCPFASFQEQNISRNRCKYLRWTNKRLRPLLCGGKRLSLPLLVNSIPLMAFITKAPIYGCIYQCFFRTAGKSTHIRVLLSLNQIKCTFTWVHLRRIEKYSRTHIRVHVPFRLRPVKETSPP